jgi:hypothetical protein
MKEHLLLHKLTLLNHHIKNKNKINISINFDNTLFILDWDDTLFPTSWVTKNSIDIVNNETRDGYIEHFKILDRHLSSFLKNILSLGNVVIVTNAMKDWVKISSIVIPKTYNILKKIEIVSARSLFSDKTNNPMDWKKNTFQLIINNFYENKNIMNVISIGDAEYEHQALVSLTQLHFDKIKYLKSFRLIREPNYDQLVEQIDLLDTYIHKFWNLNKQLCKTFKIE